MFALRPRGLAHKLLKPMVLVPFAIDFALCDIPTHKTPSLPNSHYPAILSFVNSDSVVVN